MQLKVIEGRHNLNRTSLRCIGEYCGDKPVFNDLYSSCCLYSHIDWEDYSNVNLEDLHHRITDYVQHCVDYKNRVEEKSRWWDWLF